MVQYTSLFRRRATDSVRIAKSMSESQTQEQSQVSEFDTSATTLSASMPLKESPYSFKAPLSQHAPSAPGTHCGNLHSFRPHSPPALSAKAKARSQMLLDQAQAALEDLPWTERGTSTLINDVAELLRELLRLGEARELFEEALEARRSTLGNRAPATLISLNNLGLLLRQLGQLTLAKPLLMEAVEARRATQGDRHPETLTAINNLGALLKASGDLDGALPLYKEALEARREVLGHSHPWVKRRSNPSPPCPGVILSDRFSLTHISCPHLDCQGYTHIDQ